MTNYFHVNLELTKNALKVTVKAFIMILKISFSNKYCSNFLFTNFFIFFYQIKCSLCEYKDILGK